MLTATALASLATLSTAATAGTRFSARCDVSHGSCQTGNLYLKSGHALIRGDVHGDGQGHLVVRKTGGGEFCHQNFPASAPPGSWSCYLHEGNYFAEIWTYRSARVWVEISS